MPLIELRTSPVKGFVHVQWKKILTINLYENSITNLIVTELFLLGYASF